MKFKSYRNGPLIGSFVISYKIDGIPFFPRMRSVSDPSIIAISKGTKELPNLTAFISKYKYNANGMYEFFRDSWNESISIAKNSSRASEIKSTDIYRLDKIDKRLVVGQVFDPSETLIKSHLDLAVAKGYEGIVLKDVVSSVCWKVKPVITLDLLVIDIEEGKKGKGYEGKMGAAVTKYGKVSSGFTFEERDEYFTNPSALIGTIIEVTVPSITPNGKLRFPSFKRQRLDKTNENLEGLALR